MADTEEAESEDMACALSLSMLTAHLPRMHAFFTSQAHWVEPITLFLHGVCRTPHRLGTFVAFHRLVQRQLEAHLLCAELSQAEAARWVALASPGGALDDLSLVDHEVLEQVRLITLVECEERFIALLAEYAAISTAEDDAEDVSWIESLFAPDADADADLPILELAADRSFEHVTAADQGEDEVISALHRGRPIPSRRSCSFVSALKQAREQSPRSSRRKGTKPA